MIGFLHLNYTCAETVRDREAGAETNRATAGAKIAKVTSVSRVDKRSEWGVGTSSGQGQQGLSAQAMSTVTHGNSISSIGNLKNDPDHLLVLVHGILASTGDWTYAEAELKRRLGKNYLIYVSSSNTYTKTFTGIDGAGKRLAEEVLQVVKKTKSLKRISFLSHSLGGLFARYAIAVLYSPDTDSRDQISDLVNSMTEYSPGTSFSRGGLIAGLEPINFITLATPHLGVRGKKQLPFLLGVPILEKLAAPIAPFFVGQTGSQLFLTDGKPDKPPLLLRMASDCDDGKFLSALGAFRCRIIYANVSYDRIPVGIPYHGRVTACQQKMKACIHKWGCSRGS
ncbi:unnamed protein product [Sphenostylis stenocarpa]|uniref:DUF676 domain-containing protein n=1 Tax=Sphenostylis stenocarpa TaxID=92480 RepID=A0AA86VF28_9FABA|nr:unnamed protein product [Sphenostylis stenocarpa]